MPQSPGGWLPGASPFVGRASELALIEALGAEAQRGPGRVVLIEGQPGLGKTRLVRELAGRAREQGWALGFGAAYEGEQPGEFGPINELLRSIRRSGPTEAYDSLTAAQARLRQPDAGGWRGLEALVEALRAVRDASTGCLLVLEDLHWADESALQLLARLGRSLDDLPLLFVGTLRPPGPTTSHRLIELSAAVRRENIGTRITLQPLSIEESRRLVLHVAADVFAPRTVEWLINRGDGNPFFLEELLRDMLVSPHGEGKLHVPGAVAELVQLRLARLPASARAAAVAIALLGSEAQLHRVAAVAGEDLQTVASAIDDLAGEGILDPPHSRQLAFRHALVRDAIYAWTPVAQRCVLHVRCAVVLEAELDKDQAAATIAEHLRAAGTREAARRAADLYTAAGRRALERLAAEDAVPHLESARQLLDEVGADEPERLALELLRAEALRRSGIADTALQAFRAAAELAHAQGNVVAEAQAALGFEQTYLATGRPRSDPGARSPALLERALSHTHREREGARWARLAAALAQARFFAGTTAPARALSVQAVRAARASGDASSMSAAWSVRRTIIWEPGHPRRRLKVANVVVALAELDGDEDRLLDALYWQVAAAGECGAMVALERAVQRFAGIAGRLRNPQHLAESLRMQAMVALVHGEVRAARAFSVEALRQGERGYLADAQIHHVIFELALTDDLDVSQLRLIEQMTSDQGPWRAVPSRRIALAYLLLRTGRVEDIEDLLDDLCAHQLRELPRDWMWLAMVCVAAELAFALRRTDWAATIQHVLQPFVGQFVVNSNTVCYGAVELALGRVALAQDHPDAERLLRTAIARHEALRAPLLIAQAQRLLGQLLLMRPDRSTEAHALLDSAANAYVAHGLSAGEDGTNTLVAEPVPASAPDHLTAREIEVLRLIASGHSNREIAAALVLSVNTVERHITNLYGKIDARGKADATAYAIRHGISG